MDFRTTTIGNSVEDRPLKVRFCGNSSASRRVLIIAGQHGDESLARKAARRFLDAFTGEDVCVAVLLDANPDGAKRKRRRNVAGVDLNRDHQRLSTPETQAIHAFARRWRPHLIVDVHTYPPRRKHLLARGWVHAADVYIDIANNPTACDGADWHLPLRAALPQWIDGLRRGGYCCDRYAVITQQPIVRHSTPDVRDARNGLALACGVPTVLVEGREATRRDGPTAAKRTVEALVAALNAVATSHLARWPSGAVEAATCDSPASLPIRSRYAESADAHQLEFLDRRHRDIGRVRLPMPYCRELEITGRAELPVAYAVPNRCEGLLEVLRRHGVVAKPSCDSNVRIMQAKIRHVEPSPHPSRPPRRLRTTTEIYGDALDDHAIVPVTPGNARLLTVFLEVHSKYALSRYRDLGIYPQADSRHPVLRLEPAERSAACPVN